MKNNKTLQWFCGSLYMLAHFFYSHLSLSLKTRITHGKTHHRTNWQCQPWNQHPTHWVQIKDLICGASLIFDLYFRVLTSRHVLAATHHIRKTYILLYCALLCFFMLFYAFSCFSVKAREKYNKSNPPYFSECLGVWLKK